MYFGGTVKVIIGSTLVGPRTSCPALVKTVAPRPIQVVPLVEVAMVFAPVPVATHKLFVYLIPFP